MLNKLLTTLIAICMLLCLPILVLLSVFAPNLDKKFKAFIHELNHKLGNTSDDELKSNLKESKVVDKPLSEYDIFIVYKDADDEESVRHVLIHSIYKDGKFWYVDGLCSIACAERTFRSDRIQELTIIRTGEYMSNQTAIRAYVRDLGKNT